MILEKQKEAMIVTDGDEINESIGMSLDLDSAQILMQMLSKNLYSDSIGSTIRECASNALDSHRRAGVEDHPIVASLKINDESNYEFSVEDFGIGLDADDVKNIISKYGKSTKRNSNTELGMMGLGFKAPLAYSSSFYFVCRKDGMERKYMMYEGEDTNTIDLLYEKSTDERNGVKVIVPVKWNDRELFYDKMKEQLAYFENVFFDVYVAGSSIKNDFTIYRNEQFQYSELSKDNFLHISLDNVYYPIDFAKLNISALEFPVALRFSLTDGIFPTPNRESIRYTQEAKEIIMNKLKLMSDFFINKYNEQTTNCKTYENVREFYKSSVRSVEVIPNVKLNVGYLSIFSDVTINNPKMDGVKHLDLQKLVDNEQDILNEYRITQKFNRGKFKEIKSSWESYLSPNKVDDESYYIYSSKMTEIKKSYLKTTLPNHWSTFFYFIKKTNPFTLFSENGYSGGDYYNILNLENIEKKYWRETIVEFQSILKTITSKFISYDDIVVPESFIQSRKKTSKKGMTRRQKMEGDIIVKKAVPLERYVDGKHCKFVTDTWKLKDIPKMGMLLVYGSHEDALKLNWLYHISVGKQKIKIITLSNREIKTLEEFNFKNVMSYSKFMEGNNKPFKRLVTAYLIHKLYLSHNSVFRKYNVVNIFSKDLHDKIKQLEEYRESNFKNVCEDIYKIMEDVANEKNLFDTSIYSEYLYMKKTLDKLYFIREIFSRMNNIYYKTANCADIRIIVDLMKYYKHKINFDLYSSSSKLEEEVS